MAKTPPRRLANKFASFDAEQTKKAFADLSGKIRETSEALIRAYNVAVEKWDELIPQLSEMQSLLSQRGEKRRAVLREAGLPTWTEWFRNFKKDARLKVSLRSVQKRLAALRAGGDRGEEAGAKPHARGAKGGRGRTPYQRGYDAAKAEMGAYLEDLTNVVAEVAGERKFAALLERMRARRAALARTTEAREKVSGQNPDALFLEEELDECIIGMTFGPAPARAIYSRELLVDAMKKLWYADDRREDYEIEQEIEEFIDYNILGAIAGDPPNMPLIVRRR